MPWPLEEHAAPPRPQLISLSAQDSRNLSELHDAYRTFCEYGWHHLTWKNLALSLTIYLSAHFPQSTDGQLHHLQPNAARSEYLAHLNVEAFGYLTKDALWVLFRRTGFTSNDEANLGYHRPFKIPAWEYLSSLPRNELQILHVDIANALQERTNTSHARIGNVLSLTPDWRPTFGAEYGVFQFLEVDLSPDDAASLNLLQIDRSVALKPAPFERPKSFLKRALSVRALQNKHKPHSAVSTGIDTFQYRKRFSWPLTEKYRRLFKPQTRRRNPGPTIDSSHTTVRPDPTLASAPTDASKTDNHVATELIDTMNSFMGRQQVLYNTPEEGDISDTESMKSSNTLDSLLDFYAQGPRLQSPKPVKLEGSVAAVPGIARPDSPVLVLNLPVARPDSPVLVPELPLLISRNPSLRVPDVQAQRAASPSSGHQSFVTAQTRASTRTDSRLSRQSSRDSFLSFETMFSSSLDLPASSAYYKLLKDHDLIPQRQIEIDWSGRGQHAEFSLAERQHVPLQVEQLLGKTRTALVESVRCKRVRLVRKIVKCNKRTGVTREDALKEVQHLYRARHAHIVRLVGTYVIGPDLAILTYPCAEWNLEQFMDLTRNTHNFQIKCVSSLRQFFTCTAKVLDFLHSFPIKHMDIKPQNFLVRNISTSTIQDSNQYKIYFTDFGISRSYASIDDCDTESPTPFTRAYAAREVVIQECRGLSADMFSLGCVYAEMLATILDSSSVDRELPQERADNHWTALRAARHNLESGLRPYHNAADDVRAWLLALPVTENEMLAVREWTVALMSNEPGTRPTARQIAHDPRLPFACLSCNLRRGPEDFEAAEPLSLTPPQESPHHFERPARTIMEVPALA
ncbi:hypothetical protein N0V90_004707 [Kalmusia sp. IMI 367209]|nr:hypothetical protein N0V90_004707 [Kalmusia sp. IMI 367209]